MSNWQMRAWAS